MQWLVEAEVLVVCVACVYAVASGVEGRRMGMCEVVFLVCEEGSQTRRREELSL